MICLQRETCTEPHVEYLRYHWTRFNVVSSCNSRFIFIPFCGGHRCNSVYGLGASFAIHSHDSKWQHSCIILKIYEVHRSNMLLSQQQQQTRLWKTDDSKYTIVFSHSNLTSFEERIAKSGQCGAANKYRPWISLRMKRGKSCAQSLSWKDQKEEDKHAGRGCPGWAVTFDGVCEYTQVFLAWSDVDKWCQFICLCKARDRISTAGMPTSPWNYF